MPSPKVLYFKDPDRRAYDRPPVPKIISIGRDKQLLAQRKDLLISAGMQVRSLTPEEAEPEARLSIARPWIFCNTVELTQLVYLGCSVRRNSPGSRLLLVEGELPAGFKAVLFHHVLKASDAPGLLVRTIRSSFEECLKDAS
jgi:hypothetical protein